ncbi:CRISPR system precrRNA processing endoribonuclease RAMP protein Cas6 [Caldanaerobacter subterraneus]|uniref:CRISPR system precrRNA processing endoribonuclease RAMP protein Cas6 n=1 Tax=Caldanaerobacter subterraneus TaxID=911092 RepID=A0A7Y2PJZ2_9THEO|nr:CRISPR system precrRNA processing endoribonuclease RAMP protein Cas6 [Caldanaerobacter subterraneus]NNG66414.1 CRISPR system precrRNA processing endoribonuclease RAMP protein Cas6 [Caldanaerobacter subterraneus]
MIDLKIKNLYPLLNPAVVKIKSQNLLKPELANKIAYELTRDIKLVRDIHENRDIPPFAIKNLTDNSFELHIMIPISETALYSHAERLKIKIEEIDYPIIKIPNIHTIKQVILNFTSPTSFRWRNSYVPYFEPFLFWKGVLNLWKRFVNFDISEEIVDGLVIEIHPVKTDFIIERITLSEKIIIPAFKGSAVLEFSKDLSSESKTLVLTLLESARHTGVGVKRAWGMGNLEYQVTTEYNLAFLGSLN